MNPRRYWEDLSLLLMKRPLQVPAGIPFMMEADSTEVDLEALRCELSDHRVTVSQRGSNDVPAAGMLSVILEGVHGLAGLMGGPDRFAARLQGVDIRLCRTRYGGYGQAHGIALNRDGFEAWTVVHELAHAWDGVNGWKLSARMRDSMGAGRCKWWYGIAHLLRPADERYWYYPGKSPPPCGIDANFNAKEDFAEAVTASVYPEEAARRAAARGWPYADPVRGYSCASFDGTPRAAFVRELLSAG